MVVELERDADHLEALLRQHRGHDLHGVLAYRDVQDTNAMIEAGFIGIPLALFLLWFAIGFPQFIKLTLPPLAVVVFRRRA